MREGKLATLVRNIVKQIDVQTRNLSKCTKAHNNTKKEVKEMASKIRSLSSQLMTGEVQHLLQALEKNPSGFLNQSGWDVEHKQIRVAGIISQPEGATSSIPSQEDEDDGLFISKAKDKVSELRELLREKCDATPELDRKTRDILNLLEKAERQGDVDKEHRKLQINEVLDSGPTFDSFFGILGRVWPNTYFTNTNLLTEDSLQGDKDLVWLRSSEAPEVLDDLERRVGSLTGTYKTLTIEKEVTRNASCIHVGVVGEGKKMFEDLSELKAHLKGLHRGVKKDASMYIT